MDYKKLAADILKLVGGNENVLHLEHCSTRLRFTLADKSKADTEQLKKTPGVMNVISKSQYQVVIGNSVIEVYDELIKICDLGGKKAAVKEEKQSKGAAFMEFVISIFQPLIPAIAGAGVLKSILLLLSGIGIMDPTSTLYVVLASISDATFYFLPMMVAVTCANTLKCNRLIAIAAVGFLLLPATTKMLAEGVVLFGITIPNIAYNAQIFPAILCVVFLTMMERFFNKVSPKAIRVFFVPMMSLAITIPVTLLILGPLGFNIGALLTKVILFLYAKLGFIAVALLSAVLPFMIALGMHKALLPYAITTYGELGYEALYLCASLAHNISESGACFGVALKTKNKELKQTAFSAGISALMGITEPALYGVTLQYKRAMIGVTVAGAVSGAFLGLMAVQGFALVGPSIASMTMFMDPANGKNFIYACIGFVIAIAGSFLIAFLSWKDEEAETIEEVKNDNTEYPVVLPVSGKVIPLSEVNDEVFASGTLGDGIAVIPENGELVSPVDGEIVMLFDTKHALGIKADDGTELLIHIGIDTVTMEGRGFEAFVKSGDRVKTNEPLIRFDLNEIKKAELDTTVCIIVSNSNDYEILNKNYKGSDKGTSLFTTRKK
ncbi:MAG: beta-glucoside-specific PTS transporter subunit IIABC [Eubacteriales bacterium]|nr:beta-glucoside-specific PTS transporter subunit IIABC [Eubacteriales bacterium]